MQEYSINFLLSAFFLWKTMNYCFSPIKHILLSLDFKIWTHLVLFQDKKIKLVLNEVNKFVSFTFQWVELNCCLWLCVCLYMHFIFNRLIWTRETNLHNVNLTKWPICVLELSFCSCRGIDMREPESNLREDNVCLRAIERILNLEEEKLWK